MSDIQGRLLEHGVIASGFGLQIARRALTVCAWNWWITHFSNPAQRELLNARHAARYGDVVHPRGWTLPREDMDHYCFTMTTLP
jgi:hypothetical protein